MYISEEREADRDRDRGRERQREREGCMQNMHVHLSWVRFIFCLFYVTTERKTENEENKPKKVFGN